MRILFITTIYPTEERPEYGTYIKNIHDIYLESGHEVTLVAYVLKPTKIQKILEIKLFWKSILKSLKNQKDFDLINIHFPYISAIPIWFQLNKIHLPIITSVHGSDIFYNDLMKRLLLMPTIPILQKSEKIIVPSDFFKKKILQNFPLEENNIFVCAPGGFDPHVFYPAGEGIVPGTYNLKLGVSFQDRKWIGFGGRIVEGKGWTTMINAYNLLRQRYPELQEYGLAIAGYGKDEGKMITLIRDLDLQDHVLMTGALNPDEMAMFFQSLELFIFPTHLEESFGLVGLEALACGTPVIASDIGGIREYLMDGHNGFLTTPGDSEKLARTIRKYLNLDASDKAVFKTNAILTSTKYRRESIKKRLDSLFTKIKADQRN